MKPKPIKERIAAALQTGEHGMLPYWDLMRLVFPADQFPNATRYSSNGGPPGCAMALGKALRINNIPESFDKGYSHGMVGPMPKGKK